MFLKGVCSYYRDLGVGAVVVLELLGWLRACCSQLSRAARSLSAPGLELSEERGPSFQHGGPSGNAGRQFSKLKPRKDCRLAENWN